MSSKFAVGDRVEFVPVQEDESYPGDHEQYRGQQGIVVNTYSDAEDAFFAGLFGLGMEIAGVKWDEQFMREALPEGEEEFVDFEDRGVFEANIRKIEEGN